MAPLLRQQQQGCVVLVWGFFSSFLSLNTALVESDVFWYHRAAARSASKSEVFLIIFSVLFG